MDVDLGGECDGAADSAWAVGSCSSSASVSASCSLGPAGGKSMFSLPLPTYSQVPT